LKDIPIEYCPLGIKKAERRKKKAERRKQKEESRIKKAELRDTQ
jgi:hypothetical protein